MVFIQHPVGATYLVLWGGWWLVIAVGRQRGAKPAYDKSQRCITCEEEMPVTEFGEAYQVYRQQTR